MTQNTFYVEIEQSGKRTVYGFTRSVTGVLDYTGDVSNDFQGDRSYRDSGKMQRIDSSLYFSPTWYTFLRREFSASIFVFIPKDVKDLDTNQYSFLVHIGAILLAIQEKDSLLAAELMHRRASVFAEFIPIMQHILKPIAAEALFAWVYGSFNGTGKFPQVYASGTPIKTGETDTATILFAAARDSLKPDPDKESPEKMFARFFAQDIPFDFTIGIVGASNHPWVESISAIDDIASAATAHEFAIDPFSIGIKRQELFEKLSAKVQVESYNPHDANAISVSIDNPLSMLKGFPGKSKAGYIRATGAAILRKARPNQYTYPTILQRIGGNPTWPENAIVMRIQF